MKNTRGYSLEQLAVMHDLLTIAMTTPKNVADVFFHYSPHVDQLDVQIHAGGWESGVAPIWDNAYLEWVPNARPDGPSATSLYDLHARVVSRLDTLSNKSTAELRAEKAAKLRAQGEALIAEAEGLTAEAQIKEVQS